MSKRKGTDYFEMLLEMARCSHKAAQMLKDTLNDFSVGRLQEHMEALHAIEHKGDEHRHVLTKKLAKEFITPIELEDIMDIANVIDDVTDSVEDVLLKAYMFNVRSIRPDALEFVQIVVDCCTELVTVVEEFADFRKSKRINSSIVELNHLEEVGDAMYTQSMRALFESAAPPQELIGWTELYSCLEKCCDNCEHAANLVEHVIMKNM